MTHQPVLIGEHSFPLGISAPGIEPSTLAQRTIQAYECPCGLVSWFDKDTPFEKITCPADDEKRASRRAGEALR